MAAREKQASTAPAEQSRVVVVDQSGSDLAVGRVVYLGDDAFRVADKVPCAVLNVGPVAGSVAHAYELHLERVESAQAARQQERSNG